MEIFFFLLGAFVLFLAIYIPVFLVRKKYENYVLKNSKALKEIDIINKKYSFHQIEKFELTYAYDNMVNYSVISCNDYLTYQLIYIQKRVDTALSKTLENSKQFNLYSEEIKNICIWNEFGKAKPLRNKKRLTKFEQLFFKKKILAPQTVFSIDVRLMLTNINGYIQSSKREVFFPKDIKTIEHKLNQKRGSFYLDNDVWESICRIERGKVLNKMRFAIYQRDHYQCQKCGRQTNDLEVDHIIPISKGGKSTFENLQTLCHQCNYEKGSNLE